MSLRPHHECLKEKIGADSSSCNVLHLQGVPNCVGSRANEKGNLKKKEVKTCKKQDKESAEVSSGNHRQRKAELKAPNIEKELQFLAT